jgi:transposase
MGSSIRSALVGSSGTLRQVQECTYAVHALGTKRCMGAHLRRSGSGQEEPVSNDRLDDRTSAPASGHRPQKGGQDKALGRSRGGLSTKIHLLADEDGLPLQFRITAGQAGEYAPAAALLVDQQAEAVIADRGYDADALVEQSKSLGARAVIPPKRNRKLQRPYDCELYKQRNRIERCFNKLKHFRRFATRYCKTIQAFRSFTALACAWIRLKLYVDTP